MKTGILFFSFENNNIYLYVLKNNNDKYEDILIDNNNINLDDIGINNIIPLYKLYMNQHLLLFLNINKFKDIYDKLSIDKYKLEKISVNTFFTKGIHKYGKHSRLKNEEIQIVLDKIKLNSILRSKL
jgi:hypothetical protein